MNYWSNKHYEEFLKGYIPLVKLYIESTFSVNVLEHKYLNKLRSNCDFSAGGLRTSASTILKKIMGSSAAKTGLYHEDRLTLISSISEAMGINPLGHILDTGGKNSTNSYPLPQVVCDRISVIVSDLYKMNEVDVEIFESYCNDLKSLMTTNMGIDDVIIGHDIDALFSFNNKLFVVEVKENFHNQDLIRKGNFQKFFETWACLTYYLICKSNGRDIAIDDKIASYLAPYTKSNQIDWNTIGMICLVHRDISKFKKRNCMHVGSIANINNGGIIDAWSFYKEFFGADFAEIISIESKFHSIIDSHIWKAIDYIKQQLLFLGVSQFDIDLAVKSCETDLKQLGFSNVDVSYLRL